MKSSKFDKTFDNLLSRQEYVVSQGNDLAKAFGNLKAFEHRLLDYCFSYVKASDEVSQVYIAQSKEILKHFGLTFSGTNYERIVRAFKTLHDNTALYFTEITDDGRKSFVMSQLFSRIKFIDNGEVEFRFSEDAAPYIFALRGQFYRFTLAELSRIKSKYGLILLKLWESKRFGKTERTIVYGSVEEWQEWFLGSARRMSPAIFKRNCLVKGIEELEKKLGIEVYLETIMNGRKVEGYEMTLIDRRQSGSSDMGELQMNIYDFLEN
ncbi:TPA: replication initiation protein [Streptococcus suis]|nr:replication initiation protein [Streptococcus suis]MCB2884345.1 replication initiation protein [Streptococcus suis]MCB2909113.1 replication initiation protein [Streptococcus suis]MCB2911232.1 replication initiation protein [Streptococcus suis]MCB2913298.1 replication initiation protein [Streptococcus suis]MCB2934799.1 replication initiation protein [Streptococcus suis]